MARRHSCHQATTGLGWRHAHYRELLERRPCIGFLEVHSENFFADGGASIQVLLAARNHYDLSLHGVGLGLGSAAGLDEWHVEQLARLVERTQPIRVSDHASFARAPLRSTSSVVHGNDLLPIAFTEAALDIMASNVQRVQDRLRRPLLIENLSTYLGWSDDTIAEPEFFNRLCRRSGCGLLLDVNNLVVNALNSSAVREGRQNAVERACAWVDALDDGIAQEIHLAGYADLGDIVIDDHGSRVRESVWLVYEHALRLLGSVPALIEWDTDVPALDVLLAEATRADRIGVECASASKDAA